MYMFLHTSVETVKNLGFPPAFHYKMQKILLLGYVHFVHL